MAAATKPKPMSTVGPVGAQVARLGAAPRRRQQAKRTPRQAVTTRPSKVGVAFGHVMRFWRGLMTVIAAWLGWTLDVGHWGDLKKARRDSKRLAGNEAKHHQMLVLRFRQKTARSVAIHGLSGFAGLGVVYGAGWWVFTHRPMLLPGMWILVAASLYAVGYALETPDQGTPRQQAEQRHQAQRAHAGHRIVAALRAANPKIDKMYRERQRLAKDNPRAFIPPIEPFDITTDTDGVQHTQVRLPGGATVAKIDMEAFAGEMDLDATQVFIDAGRSPSDARITILPGPLASMPAKPWPHFDSDTIDPFAGLVLGSAPSGRPLIVDFIESSTAVSGEPGTGKTDLLRKFAAAAAASPHAVLVLANCKGNGDFLPLEPLAQMSVIGSDADDLGRLANGIQWVEDEVKRRNAEIRDLAAEAPKQKLNQWLIDNRQWGPLMILIDEANLVTVKGPHQERIMSGLHYIAEKGRSVGGVIVVGSQRFTADDMGTAILNMCHNKIAFKLGSDYDTKAVFAGGWTGPKPHLFGDDSGGDVATAKAQGVCAVSGALSGGKVVRCSETTIGALTPWAEAVRGRRLAAGELSGHAVDQPVMLGADSQPAASIPVDVDRQGLPDRVRLVADGATFMGTDDLLSALAARWPEHYGNWTATKLGRQLNLHDIPKAIEGGRRGYNLAYLDQASTISLDEMVAQQ